MEKTEHGVDDAVFLQQGLPGHGPKQKVHPHRDDEDQDDELALVSF